MRNFSRLSVITAAVLLFGLLPACKQIQLKQLPAIPARITMDNQPHAEAHKLSNKEINEYTGLATINAPFCAWHVVIYNPSHQTLYLNNNSWSISPYSHSDIEKIISRQHGYIYVPAGIIVGGCATLGLIATIALPYISLFTLVISGGAVDYTAAAVTTMTICVPLGVITGIATPFVTYNQLQNHIKNHSELLSFQLLQNNTKIEPFSSCQGIAFLPKEYSKETWKLKLFSRTNEYTFKFNEDNE